MNQNNTADKREEVEIDLQRLFKALLKRAWIIIIASILGAVLSFFATFFFVTPLYQSSAMFYVNNNSLSVGDTSFSISQGDITASKNLVDSYIVILKTRTSLNDVIDYTGVDRTYSELRGMISAASVNSTEIFEVVVTSPDPLEAEEIATAIAYILPKRISSIVEGTSAKVVDTAVIPSSPSSPSYPKNVIIGFMLGLLVSVGAVILKEIFDITIREEEDIKQSCKYPVLAAVPDMAAPSKGGYYYYSSQKKSKNKTPKNSKGVPPIGENVSFAATEAYKLLRTKVQFSFADDSDCHVIGVSSAMAGEGKSLSAVNLAYSLAQLDEKVLLIECDLRRPSLSTKLPIAKVPGLSNYLTRRAGMERVLQSCWLDGGNEFHVISSGRVPPNPIELLSSERMSKTIERLKRSYDYIILDLPPVSEVSDALVAAKLTDGILLVVRQNYCNRKVLEDTVRQFDFVDAHVLGVVFNCTVENKPGYGRKYYKKYYGNYESSYEAAAEAEKQKRTEARKERAVARAEQKEQSEVKAPQSGVKAEQNANTPQNAEPVKNSAGETAQKSDET